MVQKEKDAKLYIKGGVVFLLFMAIALFTFFCFVQRDVDKNVKKTLRDNVERQNSHLQTILDLQFQHLETVADTVAHEEELTSEENMRTIRALQENSDFERVSIIDAEGDSHYDEGSVKNVTHRRYFKEGIAGNRTLSDPLESSIDGQTRVVIGVPIYENGDREQKVIGILAASYDMTALSRMLFEDIYGGKGISMILTGKGEVISYDSSNMVAGSALESIGKNLFGKYEVEIQNDSDAGKVADDFKEEKSGCSELNTGNNVWYMAYAPLSYNGWMVCYAIPAKSARSSYQFINQYEFVLCLALVVAVMILIISIMLKVKQRQQVLIDYANTDALTGLSNKDKTKYEIEQWLDKKEEHRGLQVFIIMDIDFFKEINDTCGHITGDLVLHKFGSFVQEQFRTGDVMGRIGGDEFVVFMKNVDSENTIRAKVTEFAEKFHELQIEELKGRTLTTSIGIAYAPDHGVTYIDLYKHADMALYETKRNGRNGYTLYSV